MDGSISLVQYIEWRVGFLNVDEQPINGTEPLTEYNGHGLPA